MDPYDWSAFLLVHRTVTAGTRAKWYVIILQRRTASKTQNETETGADYCPAQLLVDWGLTSQNNYG